MEATTTGTRQLTISRTRILDNAWVKEALVFTPVYFFLALIELRVKLFLTPSWFDGTLERDHAALMQFDYFNNEQSRLLQYLIPEFLNRVLSLSIGYAYILQRWAFVLIALVCFHFFLRKWFDRQAAFAGVLFLSAIMPLGYIDDLQESSPLLLVTFLLGLWAIRERRTVWFIVISVIGGLNNETTLVLPLAYLFYNYVEFKPKALWKLCTTTFFASLPLVLTVGTIRYITRNQPHLGGAWHWSENVRGILSALRDNPLAYYDARYLYVVFIFGAFWLYALMSFRGKPLFLQRVSLIIPFFILAHLITGVIYEVRQMVPLGFIVIPMAMFYLFPAQNEDTLTQHIQDPVQVAHEQA